MAANGQHTAEEHWVVRRFSPDNEEDAVRHLMMLLRARKSGPLTFHLHKGGIGMIEFKEKIPERVLQNKT